MLKSFKIEINPTLEQKIKINKTIGTCRFVYNFYIAHNKKVYETEKKFISGMDFQKWLNNTYLKEKIADIIFSDLPIKNKRIAIRKLRRSSLSREYMNLFLKLLEYIEQV